MDSYKFYKTHDTQKSARLIADRLSALSPKKVLLFLSGGSSIALAVELQKHIPISSSVCITLADERFGSVGHKDSNWQQLVDAGFDFGKFDNFPILKGESFKETVFDFNNFLIKSVVDFDYRMALLGMGTDGHTAGILPGSEAFDSLDFACGYQAKDYLRITIAPAYIPRIDEAYLYAMGSNKYGQLEKLQEKVDSKHQPAQLLKQVSKLSIISDYEGKFYESRS